MLGLAGGIERERELEKGKETKREKKSKPGKTRKTIKTVAKGYHTEKQGDCN